MMIFVNGMYLREKAESYLQKAYKIEGWEIYLSGRDNKATRGMPFTLFMALPFLSFPLASIVIIVEYLSTLPLSKLLYLKANLFLLSVTYGGTLLVLSIFLYCSWNNTLTKLQNKKQIGLIRGHQ